MKHSKQQIRFKALILSAVMLFMGLPGLAFAHIPERNWTILRELDQELEPETTEYMPPGESPEPTEQTTPTQALTPTEPSTQEQSPLESVESRLEFTQPLYTVKVPKTDSVLMGAVAVLYDANGIASNDAIITYALSAPHTGVSIDATTGTITISSEAEAGVIGLLAYTDSYTAEAELIVSLDNKLVFDAEEYTVEAGKTVTVSATMLDGNAEPIVDAVITYGLVTEAVGVSVDAETGLVTVEQDATAESVELIATCEDYTATTNLVIVEQGEPFELEVKENEVYLINITGDGVTSFAGRKYTVTYDAQLLEPIDLCAVVQGANLQTGAVPGTMINVVSIGEGTIVFEFEYDIPEGQAWFGVLNALLFKATGNGNTMLSVNGETA